MISAAWFTCVDWFKIAVQIAGVSWEDVMLLRAVTTNGEGSGGSKDCLVASEAEGDGMKKDRHG